jgi:hypothetical protein
MTLQDRIEHTNAIADAIQRNESHYSFDLDNKLMGPPNEFASVFLDNLRRSRTIGLPAPQIAGTMTQRRSYAMGKAMDILQNLSL